jgi:hypothetical protein
MAGKKMNPQKAKEIIISSKKEAHDFSIFITSDHKPSKDLQEICDFLTSPLDSKMPSNTWLQRAQKILNR